MLEVDHLCITTARFEQLCRAEVDANMLKAFIADAYEHWLTIDRESLRVLYTMFIGNKED